MKTNIDVLIHVMNPQTYAWFLIHTAQILAGETVSFRITSDGLRFTRDLDSDDMVTMRTLQTAVAGSTYRTLLNEEALKRDTYISGIEEMYLIIEWFLNRLFVEETQAVIDELDKAHFRYLISAIKSYQQWRNAMYDFLESEPLREVDQHLRDSETLILKTQAWMMNRRD